MVCVIYSYTQFGHFQEPNDDSSVTSLSMFQIAHLLHLGYKPTTFDNFYFHI